MKRCHRSVTPDNFSSRSSSTDSNSSDSSNSSNQTSHQNRTKFLYAVDMPKDLWESLRVSMINILFFDLLFTLLTYTLERIILDNR